MVTKIETYKSVDDFANVAKRIISGNKGTRGLLQSATVAAIAHMSQHGNINVLIALDLAGQSFGRNLYRQWSDYVQAYSWLKYNPDDLRGQALTKAESSLLWKRNADKDMKANDATKAAETNWYDYKKPSAPTDREVNVPDAVKRMRDRLTKALVHRLATGADGKPVTLDTVENMLKDMIAGISADVLKSLKEKDAEKASAAPPVEASKPQRIAKPAASKPSEPAQKAA